jgi:hypothetical protein
MLRGLGLEPAELLTLADDAGDAVSPTGRHRPISADLDIIRTYAVWAPLDPAAFASGGLFDCAEPEVFCGPDPTDLGGHDLVLAAMQANGHIGFGDRRGAELTVAFDRSGHANAPSDFTLAGYAGVDLVLIVQLDVEGMVAIEFDGEDYAAVALQGRVRIVGDTALFAVAAMPSEQPSLRFVNQEDRWYCHLNAAEEVVCNEPDPWERGQLDYAPRDALIEPASAVAIT